MLIRSRFPSWMRGTWLWPMGRNHSPGVVHLYGLMCLVLGAAALILTVLLLFLPAVLIINNSSERFAVGMVLSIVALLFVCGLALSVRIVMLSRR